MSNDWPVSRSRYETPTIAPGSDAILARMASVSESLAKAPLVETRTAIPNAKASPTPANLVPDSMSMPFLEKQRADDERDQRDDDRIYQSCVDIPRSRNERSRDQWEKSAKPPVAEMVRERE